MFARRDAGWTQANYLHRTRTMLDFLARKLHPTPAPQTESFDVNIGNRSLQRYVVTFDYVRGLLTIAP